MSPRCTRILVGGATALGIGLFAALPGALSASAATTAKIPTIKAHHVLYDVGIHRGVTRAGAASAAASFAFTHYTASVKVGSKSYTYTIAGKNPAIKTSNPASTITAVLVPVVMKFPGNGLSLGPDQEGQLRLRRERAEPVPELPDRQELQLHVRWHEDR